MEVKAWMVWMIFAAVFIVGELFTTGFFLLWFGIGAGIAGLVALLKLGAAWQWGTFIVVSGILFAVSRKFADRITSKATPGVGADRVIGKEAVVLVEIDNEKSQGRVRLEKEEWNADSATGEIIAVGEKTVVEKMEGTHLIVNKKGDD